MNVLFLRTKGGGEAVIFVSIYIFFILEKYIASLLSHLLRAASLETRLQFSYHPEVNTF